VPSSTILSLAVLNQISNFDPILAIGKADQRPREAWTAVSRSIMPIRRETRGLQRIPEGVSADWNRAPVKIPPNTLSCGLARRREYPLFCQGLKVVQAREGGFDGCIAFE
jgi:hypothetical protein